MTENMAFWIVDRIYNTFGRAVPKQSSGQFQTLYDNIQNIPDVCAKFIARKATEMDSMPCNLSKFFLACWEEWKGENPSFYKETCQMCGGYGGWWYFKRIEGTREWHDFYSPCPSCTYLPSRMRERLKPSFKSPRELTAEGCMVVPNDYKGGVLGFRSDKGLDGKITEQPVNEKLAEDMQTVMEGMNVWESV